MILQNTASNGAPEPHTNGKAAQATNGSSKSIALNGSSKSQTQGLYCGHNREELTRLLIQAMSAMGYQDAADSVSEQSGFELESPSVVAFRNAILEGVWSQAEILLLRSGRPGNRDQTEPNNGLILAENADYKTMTFWIRQQKYLELLENRDTTKATMVLRDELLPLSQDPKKLNFLSSLLFKSPDDMMANATWDGAEGRSRQILLSELSKCISPSVMLPEHRLATLLNQVKGNQIGDCLWHSSAANPTLYSDHVCDRRQFPRETVLELDDHRGEVWQVVFSHDGRRLASCGGGPDEIPGEVFIWDVPSFEPIHHLENLSTGVGNIAWSWDDTMFITCCIDGTARLWDAETGAVRQVIGGFSEPVSSAAFTLDNKSFILGSLDKQQSLTQYSVSGEKIYDWGNSRRVEDLAMSPDGRRLVTMDDKQHIQIYNMTTRELKHEFEVEGRLLSISISQDSRFLLTNRNHENMGKAELIDLAQRSPLQEYKGHTAGRFMIRNALGGAHESFVISGSEDGFINIWHKTSATRIEKLSGHMPRTNSVAWCPTNPRLFASCGDDGKVKIWSNPEWRQIHRDTMVRRHLQEANRRGA